jgi:hypothetical protein
MERASMHDFTAVLFFGVLLLLWFPRIGWSTSLPLVVTLVPFLGAVYLIVSGNLSAIEQRWVYGTAAAILGYWLKPGDG